SGILISSKAAGVPIHIQQRTAPDDGKYARHREQTTWWPPPSISLAKRLRDRDTVVGAFTEPNDIHCQLLLLLVLTSHPTNSLSASNW
ncbi:hypothetical protein, partial [Pseudomonas aeruginosa]